MYTLKDLKKEKGCYEFPNGRRYTKKDAENILFICNETKSKLTSDVSAVQFVNVLKRIKKLENKLKKLIKEI